MYKTMFCVLNKKYLHRQVAEKICANREEKVHEENRCYRRPVAGFLVSHPDKVVQDCGDKQTVDDHGKQHE